MSKGIVMEKHRKYAVIMTIDGSFHKVRPVRDASIGAEVSYEILASKKSGFLFFQNHKQAKYIAVACMVLLIVMPFYFFAGQNKTYAYVNLDINPSLEIEVNKNLTVVSISPLNDDAEKLIKQLLGYEDKEIEQVIEEIMNRSDELGLMKNGKNVLVGVSYVEDQDVGIINTIDQYFLTHNTSWNIATFRVSKELRERALKENKPMNKVMAETLDDVATDPKKRETKTQVNDDEKELIYSFYSNKQPSHQHTENSVPVSNDQAPTGSKVKPKPEKEKIDQHAKDPEEKNREFDSHGKKLPSAKPEKKDDHKHKGKPVKEKHEKKHRNHKDKQEHSNNGKKDDHGKHHGNHVKHGKKDDHQDHGNHGKKHKGNHGNENHGNHGNKHNKDK